MKLSEYPAAIEAARLEILKLDGEIEDLRESLGQIKDQITANVATALDENNKPLYSNEAKRAAAIATDLREHGVHQTQFSILRNVERERAEKDARIERLRNEFKLLLMDRREAIARAEASA